VDTTNEVLVQEVLSCLGNKGVNEGEKSLIITQYNLTLEDIHNIVLAWLNSKTLMCDGLIVEFFNRNAQYSNSIQGFNISLNMLFNIGMQHNDPIIWCKVFDFAVCRDEWKGIIDPAFFFSREVDGTFTHIWRNVFRCNFEYKDHVFPHFEKHLVSWKKIIHTRRYTYEELFDLWVYTNCSKEILIEILSILDLSNQQLVNFGNKSRCWKTIYEHSALTRDLTELQKLDITHGVDHLIQTGYVGPANKLIAYGRKQKCEQTWKAILISRKVQDIRVINMIIGDFPSCAYTAVDVQLSDDLVTLMSWAVKDPNAFESFRNKLTKGMFPLPVKIVKI
jgi:hypothetical protein